MHSENSSRTGDRDPGSSNVVQPTLFYKCAKSLNRHTENAESVTTESSPSSLGQSSSATSQLNTDGMQVIRESLCEREISPDIADIIMLSWRDSTRKQYQVYIKKWFHFCSEKSVDPMHPTVNMLLEFLHSLHQNKLGYSALNTARSAVSNIDENSNNGFSHTPVGKHPLVSRYLKGIFNKLKPVPKYRHIWSVDTVLEYLRLYWPLNEINRKELTHKLVMLIMLTTGQRCQTLTFMDISDKYMEKREECFSFALREHIKQDKPGSVFGNVTLYRYPVKELCVYETLEYYLEATKSCRSSNSLIISYIKPYRAVTSSTIGRWIKAVLGQAGIDASMFTAHSTRSAATSKAAMAAVPVDVILKTAGWSAESTFRKFYKRPVVSTNQMSVSVLQR